MSVGRRVRVLAVLGLLGLSLPGTGQETTAVREVSYRTGDGGVIHANVYGEGSRAVLLAHGAVFDKESWEPLARRLSAAGYRVLAIDFRGYGKSTAGRSAGALHEDVLGGIRFLRENGAERVSLIGASMGGGAVGEAAARAQPGALDKVILLAAVPVRTPGRMQGAKLFIVARDDTARASVERQYAAAGEPKEMTVLPGGAHAQHIFRTAQAEALTEAILRWLDRGS